MLRRRTPAGTGTEGTAVIAALALAAAAGAVMGEAGAVMGEAGAATTVATVEAMAEVTVAATAVTADTIMVSSDGCITIIADMVRTADMAHTAEVGVRMADRRGGYTSYYGSTGGYGSSGGYGSTGGYGSSGGGVIYNKPADGVVAPPAAAPEAKVEPNQGALKVQVPEDALVYVNGILTKSTGANRSYVSRGLVNGFQYTYEVRAEAVREGKKIEETKTVTLKAGETLALAFDNLHSAQSQETTLTLNVPEDAKVSLGGNPTSGEGTVRVFTTSKLGSNKEWSNYLVQVTVERDGRTLTQEKNVTLKAGDNQTLSFDFDSAQVASTR